MRTKYKTARCILHRDGEYLLAVHSSFWGRKQRRWGLPGGQIERGESPESAVLRELEEELSLYVPAVMEIGAFHYKRSLHMVYAAEINEPIVEWDDSELLDVRWFREDQVADLKTTGELHASYELEAIRALLQKLGD